LGQAASPSLYDFAGGDPVNNFDSDGRCPQNPQSPNNWGQNIQNPNPVSPNNGPIPLTPTNVAAVILNAIWSAIVGVSQIGSDQMQPNFGPNQTAVGNQVVQSNLGQQFGVPVDNPRFQLATNLTAAIGSFTLIPDASSPEVQVPQVLINKAAGDAWEQQVVNNVLPLTQTNIQTQITITSNGPSGLNVRLDAVGTLIDTGAISLTDAKASPTAPLTTNQTIVYPELDTYGGTVAGQGKPPYVGGTPIPPTSVNIIVKPK
jgi:hypothetical protein